MTRQIALIFILIHTLAFPLYAQQPEKIAIAVNDLKGKGIEESVADIVSERLRSELIKCGGFRVMERNEMTTILKEQGFQQTGICDEASCLVEVGQLLGVERVVSGTIGKIESFYTISLRIIHVGTGEILITVDEDFEGTVKELLTTAVPGVALKVKRKAFGDTSTQYSKQPEDTLASPHEETLQQKNPKQLSSEKKQCKDADNNVYHTVIIGKQEWTVENLRTTKYNDGNGISHVMEGSAWGNLSTPGYCFYNNTIDANYKEKWGALYNWYTVNTGKLAPAGWRVATDEDWRNLEKYLVTSGYNWDGTTSGEKVGKSIAAKTDWKSSSATGAVGNNISSNNRTGFSALPGGCRDFSGNFVNQNFSGNWWSSTVYDANCAFFCNLLNFHQYLSRSNFNKRHGFSVRLVRDLK